MNFYYNYTFKAFQMGFIDSIQKLT